MEKRAWFYFWLLNHNLFFFILRFALFEWIVIINDHGGWVGTLGKSVTSDSRNLSSCILFLYRPLCPAFKPQTLHFLPTAFSLRNSQPLFRLNYRPRWRSDDSPIKCLLISSSSVWWLSIARPRASTQVWRRKYLRRCEQKRLLCPTEGTFESFPVLECPEEESWVGAGGRKESRMTVVGGGWWCSHCIRHSIDSIAFDDLAPVLFCTIDQGWRHFGPEKSMQSGRGPLRGERKEIKPWNVAV